MAFGGFQVGPYQPLPVFQQFVAGATPASGPQVVLLPLQPLCFRTRADMAMYALATFTKHCALHTRESYPRLIPEYHRSMRGSLRV